MAKRLKPETRFVFQFLGWQDGWYALRANTGRRPPLSAHEFENKVLEWLIDQGILPNQDAYLANGNTGDGPIVPAAADGSAFCLLLKRPSDVVRFDMAFRCRGITAETMFAAIRQEASIHKFILADLAEIAYTAIRQHAIIFGQRATEWDDLDADDQQLHLQLVREYIEHPNWTPEKLHQAWVDTRLLEGWHYAASINLEQRQHPLLVPYNKLSVFDQMKMRLIASVVEGLASSL